MIYLYFIIKKNNGLDKAVKIAGCPPKVGKYLPALMNETLEKNRARIIMLKAMIKMIGFKMGLYYEDIGLWEQYKSEDFDLGHFS